MAPTRGTAASTIRSTSWRRGAPAPAGTGTRRMTRRRRRRRGICSARTTRSTSEPPRAATTWSLCFLQYGTLTIILGEASEDEVAEAHHFYRGQEAIQGDITLAMGGSHMEMGVMLKVLFQK
uniref:Uncharacterized protein n=1 Tax=Arundo donax TaxID=35708 RepID=A0A0A9D7I9_ARUDO